MQLGISDDTGPAETVKKTASKAEIRAKLEAEVDRFLRGGGQVQNVPQGTSGKDPGDPPLFLNRRLFIEPKATRTPVPEVVAAIEARRKANLAHRKTSRKGRRATSRRRKVIYDDFGEPLRKVWLED